MGRRRKTTGWYPKKKRTTASANRTTAVQRRAPGLDAQAKARLKRGFSIFGYPRNPSPEELEELTEQWRTVRLEYIGQAKRILQDMQDIRPFRVQKLIRNLWCHTDILQAARFDSTVTRDDALAEPVAEIANEVASAGTVEKLAIDITLASQGWLSESTSRPRHVMILQDEFPERGYNLQWNSKVFLQTTHVVIEPLLYKFYHMLPMKGLKTLFPRMRVCCIQILVTEDVPRALAFVQDMLFVVEKLVVSINAVRGWYCCRDQPLWSVLRALAKTQPKLVLVPHKLDMKQEWRKILTDQKNIWDAEVDEDEYEKLPTIAEREEYWTRIVRSGMWHDKEKVYVEEELLARHPEEANPANASAWMEEAQKHFDDIALPGARTPIDDLEAICDPYSMMGISLP
ncbi:uncharacterized protein B0H18DRAFT_952047 [Fomitopsis serialis]|uniref:uncharacterized protein n=1 Tax=Fomitopsis serialis TaxID=139415 RepID=UPI002008C440|nr:uncharacterized protein B0H18DRAFT_952047 [Neoantrodia serialis]KAH9932856.1 hypothetical protein B0H18DRAFT_952047 [Neoantrodia serialis]